MADPIPGEVRVLLERHITSVSQLEVLCLLVEDRRSWTPAQVSDELRLTASFADGLLESLAAERLIHRSGDRYAFAPSEATRGSHIEALVACYHRYRLRVTSAIYAQPSKPIRDFADAFRLRNDADEPAEED